MTAIGAILYIVGLTIPLVMWSMIGAAAVNGYEDGERDRRDNDKYVGIRRHVYDLARKRGRIADRRRRARAAQRRE